MKCCIKGCRKKGNIDFQTRRWSEEGKLDSFPLCYSHGFFMTSKELIPEMEKTMTVSTTGPIVNTPKRTEKETLTLSENKETLTLSNYSSVTGKRFRMTKEQKSRDLTREQAFQEFMSNV